MESREFVATLVAEMDGLLARLGEHEALESESGGRLEVPLLLRLALKSELEASDLAGLWLPTTREIDVKRLLARQCADEVKHYELIVARLAELGHPVADGELDEEGPSPLYHYLAGLHGTVERVAGGPFAREAIARVRNEQFIAFCRAAGDLATAELYVEVIQPEEVAHHALARELLERYCTTPQLREQAATAARTTLAIADELRTLAEKTTGSSTIPVS